MTGRKRLITMPYLFLLLMSASLFAQAPEPSPSSSLGDRRIPIFEVTDAGFVEAVSALSFADGSGLHIGFEEVLRPRGSQVTLPEPKLTMKLSDATVRQILDRICN